MNVGFIGFGEVGYEIARGLVYEGIKNVYAFDPLQTSGKKGEFIKERAKDAKVTLLESAEAVADTCEMIFSVVPGAFALNALSSVLKKMRQGKIYVDLSTSLPSVKKEMNKLVKPSGAKFADGALMASLSQSHYKVPILLAGAASDQVIDTLQSYGMLFTKISENAGDAIAVKLVRSIYMKGIAALGAEMLDAANLLNVDRLVLDSISETLNAKPFEETNTHLVIASAWHGDRQVHEMEDVTKMLKDLGIEPVMSEATAKKLEWLRDLNAKEYFSNHRPEDWQDVAKLWDRKNSKL